MPYLFLMNFGQVKALTESRCGASREGSNAEMTKFGEKSG